MDYRQEFVQCRELVEARLNQYFTEPGLEQAMRYSLLAGGKRIRPVLLMKFCQTAGGTLEQALDAACGVEMLHTYSLIHDDLPCMDNDDLRRGKPTCHKMFGECTATLAGDALQAAAFEAILSASQIEECDRAKMALLLSKAVGASGMCGGQYLDMDAEGHQPTLEELSAIHAGKTAALLRAVCQMGVLAAGARPKTAALLEAAGRYADHLGLAFQIRDDLLDMISTTEALGKPVGSDDANGKHTFVTLLGQDACTRRIAEETELAKKALTGAEVNSGFLCWLADELAGRTH